MTEQRAVFTLHNHDSRRLEMEQGASMGSCMRLLATRDRAGASADESVLDVLPRGVDLPTVATVHARAKADVLGRQRHHHLSLGRDAHAVRGGLGATERPAAAARRLMGDGV
jgi:hypothetical protein